MTMPRVIWKGDGEESVWLQWDDVRQKYQFFFHGWIPGYPGEDDCRRMIEVAQKIAGLIVHEETEKE
jgi:hypothetical protein